MPHPHPSRPYWWFQGESVSSLVERLEEYENPRLEVHLHGDTMTFWIADGDGADTEPDNDEDDDPINEGHICPPICP